MKRLNTKGQGATEYIVILAIIVGIALLFSGSLSPAIKSKIDSVVSMIKGS